MSNELRMHFADWLEIMGERDLGAPGRIIAIYSAVYDIVGNDDLAQRTGVAGRTLDKWKQLLLHDGWVIITQRRGGRGVGIEVIPALDHTPVILAGLSKKKGSNKYPRKEQQTGAEKTPVRTRVTPAILDQTGAEIAPLSAKGAEFTGVSLARNSNNIINNINNLPLLELEVVGSGFISPREAIPYIDGLNGSTVQIVETVARLFSQHAPDLIMAREQVQGACEAYGVDNFKDGYVELSAKVADRTEKAFTWQKLHAFARRARTRREDQSRKVSTGDAIARGGSESEAAKLKRLADKVNPQGDGR